MAMVDLHSPAEGNFTAFESVMSTPSNTTYCQHAVNTSCHGNSTLRDMKGIRTAPSAGCDNWHHTPPIDQVDDGLKAPGGAGGRDCLKHAVETIASPSHIRADYHIVWATNGIYKRQLRNLRDIIHIVFRTLALSLLHCRTTVPVYPVFGYCGGHFAFYPMDACGLARFVHFVNGESGGCDQARADMVRRIVAASGNDVDLVLPGISVRRQGDRSRLDDVYAIGGLGMFTWPLLLLGILRADHPGGIFIFTEFYCVGYSCLPIRFLIRLAGLATRLGLLDIRCVGVGLCRNRSLQPSGEDEKWAAFMERAFPDDVTILTNIPIGHDDSRHYPLPWGNTSIRINHDNEVSLHYKPVEHQEVLRSRMDESRLDQWSSPLLYPAMFHTKLLSILLSSFARCIHLPLDPGVIEHVHNQCRPELQRIILVNAALLLVLYPPCSLLTLAVVALLVGGLAWRLQCFPSVLERPLRTIFNWPADMAHKLTDGTSDIFTELKGVTTYVGTNLQKALVLGLPALFLKASSIIVFLYYLMFTHHVASALVAATSRGLESLTMPACRTLSSILRWIAAPSPGRQIEARSIYTLGLYIGMLQPIIWPMALSTDSTALTATATMSVLCVCVAASVTTLTFGSPNSAPTYLTSSLTAGLVAAVPFSVCTPFVLTGSTYVAVYVMMANLVLGQLYVSSEYARGKIQDAFNHFKTL